MRKKVTSKKVRAAALTLLFAGSMMLGMVPGSIRQVSAADDFAEENSMELYGKGDKVDTISPTGIIVDLFDYQQFDDDKKKIENIESDGTYGEEGINAGHSLKFSKGIIGTPQSEDDKIFNIFTGSQWMKRNDVFKGIVQNQLGADGYPVLSNDLPTGIHEKKTQNDESLNYLFDPRMENVVGRKAYPNVQNLLEVDEDSYYSFDSANRFARFDESSNRFDVTKSTKNFGFFPFNEIEDNGAMSQPKNSHLGVSMTTRFLQTNGGKKPDNTDVVYEFTGDDDVWIFIDGQLVADLGGIHDKVSVEMNFHTGAITINGTTQEETIGDILNTGGVTLIDNTIHTLKFFYLERGAGDSNMKLRFNLMTVPDSQIDKTDEIGTPLAGASFELYEADKDYTIKGDAIVTGSTGSEGTLTLEDVEGRPIYFADLYNKNQNAHYVLKETEAPAGYRKAPDMYLEYDPTTGAVLSANHWETGTYASGKERVILDNKDGENRDPYEFIEGLKVGQKTVTTAKELIADDGELTQGHFFALPLRYTGNGETELEDSSKWYGVYGNSNEGYHLSDANGKDLQGIVQAVHENGAKAFSINTTGQYQVDVDDLPGLLSDYYFVLNKKGENSADTKWTVGFYYTLADEKDLSGVTADNTVRLRNSDYFPRQFSANLRVADMKNELYVHKKDAAGNPVNGAMFSLYKTEELEDTITADELRKTEAYDTVRTEDLMLEGGSKKGTARFPSGDDKVILESGNYYLVETKAPTGYKLNDSVVPITIDNSGVYANATAIGRTAEEVDDVAVRQGVGHLIHSMAQFAYGVTDGSGKIKVDTTLHDIKAAVQSKEEWNDEWSSPGNQEKDWFHLEYGAEGRVIDYGPEEKGGDPVALIESGWSKLAIRQCIEEGHKDNSDYEDLTKREDLSSLFAGYTVVEVTDERTADLDISKIVNGYENIDSDDLNHLRKTEFGFDIRIFEKDGTTPLKGTYTITNGINEPIGTVTGGSAKITLTHDSHAVIQDIPEGAKYSIVEKETSTEETEHFDLDLFETTITTNDLLKTETKEDPVIDNKARTITGVIRDVEQSDEENAFKPILITYMNVYQLTPAVIPNIQGSKTIAGRDWNSNDTFDFVIRAGATETEDVSQPMPTETEITVEAPKDVQDTKGKAIPFEYDFSNVQFTVPGTYEYQIYERQPTDEFLPGMSYSQALYRATVDVTNKNADGKYTNQLKATVSMVQLYDDENKVPEKQPEKLNVAAFTNTYDVAEANYTVSATKNLIRNGVKETPKDGQFTFRMTAQESTKTAGGQTVIVPAKDVPMPNGTDSTTHSYEKTNDGDSIAFGSIAFDGNDAGAIYKYRVEELLDGNPVGEYNNFKDGVIYDSSKYYVSVSITQEANQLTISDIRVTRESETGEVSVENNAIVFENSYEAQPVTVSNFVQGTKTLKNGAAWNPDGHFEFVMKPADETTAAALEPDNTANIAPITFDTLQPEDPKAVIVEDMVHEDGSRTFNYGNMTFRKAGIYVFDITEVSPSEQNPVSGMTYDKHTAKVTITVTDRDASGAFYEQLKAMAVYDNDTANAVEEITGITDAAAFVNTYSETGNASLTGIKRMEGRNFRIGDSFTFKVEAEEGTPLPSSVVNTDGKRTINPTQGTERSVNFGTIPFTAAGQSYTYTITEELPEDDDPVKEGVQKNAVTYDPTEYQVVVTSVPSGNYDGTLTFTYTINSAEVPDSSALVWTNTYSSEGMIVLEGMKVLTGRDWEPNETYSFTLQADEADEYTKAALDSGAIVLPESKTAAVKGADGKFTFDQITFTKPTEGRQRYRFVITEDMPVDDNPDMAGVQKSGVTYDEHKYYANVSVTDDGQGKLTAVFWSENSNIFTNTFNPVKETVTLEGAKSMVGRELRDTDKFRFTIKAITDGAPLPAVTTVENTADKITFAPISYEIPESQAVYEYVITENDIDPLINGVTKDEGEIHATVTITFDPATGKTAQQVDYTKEGGNGGEGFAFVNKYETIPAAPIASIEAMKSVTASEGNSYELTGGEFEFTITPSANNDKATDPIPETVEVTNDVQGRVLLAENVVFTTPGTYKYTVAEVSNGLGGMTYDDTVYTVQVVVSNDEGDAAQLITSMTLTNNDTEELVDRMTFDNAYDPAETSVTFRGTKNLTGKELMDGDFTFVLEDVSGEEAVTTEKTVETVTNTAGTFTFGKIKYTVPGIYQYQIREVNDGKEGYIYDETVYDITVEVTDVDGKLTASVIGAEEIVFNNRYTPNPITLAGETALKAKKTLEGRDLMAEEFTFELKDEDGNVVATGKNDVDGNVAFSELTFEETGVYEYTISEKNDAQEDVIYDNAVYDVTVTVTDNGDGSLIAEVSYADDKTPLFTNKYTKPSEPSEPGEPDQPSEPEEPTEPEKPDEPDKPSEPEEPSEPDNPSKPSEPSEPGKPSEQGQPEDSKLPDVVQTGDNTPIVGLVVVMSLALVAIIVIAIRIFRRRR